ncbi:PREDICTED: uncharacterized protein LOC108365966 [Rhagoletis zephyria]|uniref:uncharacterized protein LOC108365966 n=1 Tax=Rhagoletis zephyria TaxID=28612 RepID=UPI000811A20A|nr:PREDICTED: uncharacterized protein LOC108365966 [Rhagoletis zephyria]
MERREILDLNLRDLRQKLTELGLVTTGRKSILQDILLEHFGLTVDGEEDDDVSEYDDVASGVIHTPAHERATFTLRDIVDSLSMFNGSGSPSIEDWLEEFEENATAVHWNNLQKFIYAKQLLRGAAKMFVRSQRGVTDWSSLKQALKSEFGIVVSSMEVHRMLRNCRKRQNESYREYLYNLMEISKPIELDELSLVTYFIEGIPDSNANKRNKASTGLGNNKDQTKRCFKCGDISHIAKDCSQKQIKCFKCGQPGHRAVDCQRQQVEVKKEKSNVNTLRNQGKQEFGTGGCIFKDLAVGGATFSALIDTGCDLCLIRRDVLLLLNDDIELSNDQISLIGVGNARLTTLGSFKTMVVVDGMELEVIFHVTRECDMRYSAVIGVSVLKLVDLVVSEGSVEFKEKVDKAEASQTGKKGSNAVVAGSCLISDEAEGRCTEVEAEFKELCQVAVVEETREPDIDLCHLQPLEASAVEVLIKNYAPVRNQKSPVEMKIVLTDDYPVHEGPRRISYADKQVVEEQIAEWLQEGIIQPSTSEYASPIVLVAKKDGSKRLCCDYRPINSKIMRDNFPMPLLDDVIERLQGAKLFTTLDLANGFFHVPVEAKSRKYTAFVTHNGQYEFRYVPFGISNSPAVFSKYIATVLRDMVEDGTVVAYMDDLIIPAKDVSEAIQKLERVLSRAA